jgi:hypothetical protein
LTLPQLPNSYLKRKNWNKILEKLEKDIITLDLAIMELYNILWNKLYLFKENLDVNVC